jgi:ribose-phosphate pyrophosphokinase
MAMVLPFPGQETFGAALAAQLGARQGVFRWRRFPDGESLVSVEEQVHGEHVAIVASLRGPDGMALPLRFAAATLREFGARSVGLVAPYLAYMRQDCRFESGQAVTAPLFAAFVEESFDWLVTVDPHLHRIPRLDAVYRKPAHCAHAAPAIAAWIRANAADALLIGPDSESQQWVSEIATLAGVPCQVLEKTRRGDRQVSVSLPDSAAARGRQPVVIDDIISSGHTIVETLRQLARLGLAPATCIGIHAVFADQACEAILAAGAARVVTCDTIVHPSNGISVVNAVATACLPLLLPAGSSATGPIALT